VFADGCRWTFTMTAGVVFIHAAWCTSSTPSIDVCDIRQAHRRTVLVGDDQRTIRGPDVS
jgi:hypothetical protein